MRIVQLSDAVRVGASAHRPGGIAFRHLLQGRELALDNYALMLVDVAGGYHAPRHRHNFEQVRVMLDGAFGFDDGRQQAPGSVGYFCEGSPYTQSGEGRSTTLLLQVAGASGHGYMSARQLQAAVEALQREGSFAEGIYTRREAGGRKHRQDGYEAAWEHTFGRAIEYPKPRYDRPVLMSPDHFGWCAVGACPGVQTRLLGAFNERGLGLRQWRARDGAGARWSAGTGRIELAFVLEGAGRAGDGDAPLAFGTAIELSPGESLRWCAARGGELVWLHFTLPRFGPDDALSTPPPESAQAG